MFCQSLSSLHWWYRRHPLIGVGIYTHWLVCNSVGNLPQWLPMQGFLLMNILQSDIDILQNCTVTFCWLCMDCIDGILRSFQPFLLIDFLKIQLWSQYATKLIHKNDQYSINFGFWKNLNLAFAPSTTVWDSFTEAPATIFALGVRVGVSDIS